MSSGPCCPYRVPILLRNSTEKLSYYGYLQSAAVYYNVALQNSPPQKPVQHFCVLILEKTMDSSRLLPLSIFNYTLLS